jgi:hypothetical protein
MSIPDVALLLILHDGTRSQGSKKSNLIYDLLPIFSPLFMLLSNRYQKMEWVAVLNRHLVLAKLNLLLYGHLPGHHSNVNHHL